MIMEDRGTCSHVKMFYKPREKPVFASFHCISMAGDNLYLADMAYKFEIGIIKLLESDRVTSLIRVTLESILSEGLLDDSPVRIETAEFLHSQRGAVLGELPLGQNLVILE